MAGTHQINTFIATMDNYGKVTEYTTEAMNSSGTAQEKYTAYMDSIQAHLNQLTTTWQEFVLNLDQSGTFNGLIDAASNLIKILDTLLNKFGLFKNLGIPVIFATLAGTLTSKAVPALTKVLSIFEKIPNAISKFNDGFEGTGSILNALSFVVTGSVSGFKNMKAEAEAAGGMLTYLSSGAKSAQAAMSGLTMGISTGVAIITALISIYQSWRAEQERILELSRDNAQEYANQNTQIQNLISEYTEINEKLKEHSMNSEEVATSKDRLAEIQENLNSLYGNEKTNIDLVNGSYEDQIEILKNLNKENARRFVAENTEGYEQAKKQNEKDNRIVLARTYKDDEISQSMQAAWQKDRLNVAVAPKLDLEDDVLQKLKDELKEKLGDKIDFDAGIIKLDVDSGEAEESLNTFMDTVEDFSEKYGVELSALSESALKAFSNFDFEAIDKNNQLILQYEQSQIMSSDKLGESYHNLLLAIDEYNKAVLSGNPEKIEETKAKLDETQASMTEFAEEYPVVYDDAISTIIDTTETAKEGVQDTTENAVDELANVAENIDLSGITEALEDVEDTDINSDIFEDLESAADNAGVSVEDLIDEMVEIGKVTPEVGDKIKSAFHTSALNDLQQELQNTMGQMAAFDSNWDTLTSAVEEFNKAGSLSAATLQSLTDNNLLQYLQLSANGLEIDRQAFLNNAEAVKAKAIEDVKAEAFMQLRTLATENNTAAEAAAVEQSGNTASAVEQMRIAFVRATPDIDTTTNALARYMAVSGGSFTGDWSKANKIISDMNNKINIIKNTTYKAASAVGSVASGAGRASKGLGGAADAARKLKEELKDAQDAINDYVDMVVDMIKQELEDQKDTLEDEKDALKDKKDAALDAIDEEAEAMDRYYEDLKDQMDREKELADRNFEDRKDQLESLKDRQDEMFEKQKDALDNELDAYKEKIKAEKELLEQKEKEKKYEQELSDKVKDVAKIQSELAALQFDDSIEAQKKKLELTEELSNKQSKLDEYQAEHNTELQEDALDKELDRYEKSHDKKIKDIEEEQDAHEKMIDAQIKALEREKKEYERNHEDKLTALEQEQKEYKRNVEDRKKLTEEEYDNEIKKVEEKIDAVDEAMDKEGALIQEAIRRIEEDADGTYKALLEWNKEYGSGIDSDVIKKWEAAKAALDKYSEGTGKVVTALDNIKKKLNEIKDAAGSAGGALGGMNTNNLNNDLDDAKKKLQELQNQIKKNAEIRFSHGTYYDVNTGQIKGNNKTQNIRQPYHTGTSYVSKVEKDKELNKDFKLKSDEVVRVLKVGESVVPKDRNKGSIARNSDLVNAENSGKSDNKEFIDWINILKENMQNRLEDSVTPKSSMSTNISPIDVSIGDIVIQGNADKTTVNELNNIRNSIVKDIFAKINKHTNLSGFKNIKGYV